MDQFSRNAPPGLNDNHLYFTKIKIFLSQSSIKIYRDFIKFTDFLAQTTALTSNILFIMVILMDKINSVLAENILIKTLFSSKTLNLIGNFESEIKTILIKTNNKKSNNSINNH